jgi:hypothetical protein
VFLQVLKRPSLGKHLSEALRCRWNVRQIAKDVGFFPVEGDCLAAVCPHADWRAFGVAVALELFQAVLAFWLFDFDDDVGRGWRVFFPNHDVGGLLMNRGAKIDRFFDGDAVFWIPINAHQLAQIELPDDLLGLGGPGLVACGAGEVGAFRPCRTA